MIINIYNLKFPAYYYIPSAFLKKFSLISSFAVNFCKKITFHISTATWLQHCTTSIYSNYIQNMLLWLLLLLPLSASPLPPPSQTPPQPPLLLIIYFLRLLHVNQATGYASQHIWCLSQARINWEHCGRNGMAFSIKMAGRRRWVADQSGWSGAHGDCRCVCLCYLPLHHKVQKKFSSGTGSPG